MTTNNFTNKIFSISSAKEFNDISIEIFHYQYKNVKIYHNYVNALSINPLEIKHFSQIPFLPIQFFKTHNVICDGALPEISFSSSGTTGENVSHHNIADVQVYKNSFIKCFEIFYGKPDDCCILALLPGYIERNNSSLVFMVNELINLSKNQKSGFYLNDNQTLIDILQNLKNEKVLLIGVTHALLDIAETVKLSLPNCTIMETGGMKGRRKEIIRTELHNALKIGFGVNKIHSEYGMTELLSQAYSKGDGIYFCPPWMKVIIRDFNDPLETLNSNEKGGINVIDLANFNSCSFIATDDIGKTNEDNSFEIFGRFDNSQIRGCSLMVE
ncbi:MAG: acyl transferase [Bacteroidetes bacterium]|nr:acyl transferase [Bacteroidota bacterium]